MNWSIQQDGDVWVVKNGDEVVGEPYDTPADALAAMDDAIAAMEQPADVEMPEGSPGRFRIPVLVPAHGATSDGRRFAMEGGSWRNPPLAMMFQNHTDIGHFGAVWSGTITRVFRNDDGSFAAEGFYAPNDDGRAHHDAVASGLRGVSMDAGADEYEIRGLEACDECDDPMGDPGDIEILFTAWTILGATGTPIPAFAEAYMENEDTGLAAGGVVHVGDALVGERGQEEFVPAVGGSVDGGSRTHLTINVVGGDPTATAAAVREALTAGPTGGSVTDKPWDGSPARFNDDQFKRATAGCRGQSDAPKTDCFLQHHEPDGTINRNGVHAAAQRFTATNAPSQAKDSAAAHLRSHYTKDLNEEPPSSITSHSRATKAGDESAIAACAAPDLPPASWFTDPGFDRETALTVLPDGRVLGHIATWRDAKTGADTCHIGMRGSCVRPPHSESGYAYFNTRPVKTFEGDTVLAGQITMDGSHASTARNVSLHEAAAHYENTGMVAADVVAGEDDYGIWVAGAIRSSLSEEDVRRFCAAKTSGDWRPIGNGTEMIAVLSVNVPGFPNPAALAASAESRTEVDYARVDARTGQVLALVASAHIPTPDPAAEWRDRVDARLARMERMLSPLRRVVAAEVDRTVGLD